MSAIRFEGVTKSYEGVLALSGFDLDVQEGEFLALLGPSAAVLAHFQPVRTDRRICGVERGERGVHVPLGHADENAVDDGQLRDPTRGRTGAERCFPGGRGQHVVGDLGVFSSPKRAATENQIGPIRLMRARSMRCVQ